MHNSPWNLPGLTQVMEWKLRPVAALEETDLLERPQCLPPKPRGPPWTPLSLMVGTLPTLSTATRSSGVGSVAAAGLLFVQTVPRLFTQPLPGLRSESHCLGIKASSQAACRMVGPWLARTKQRTDLGPASGSCYWRASAWPSYCADSTPC